MADAIIEYRSLKHERFVFRTTREHAEGLNGCGRCPECVIAANRVLDMLRDLKAVEPKGNC